MILVEAAIQAARNFRALRDLGVTVRKTIATVIATRCIESGYDLLHSDRHFDPFAKAEAKKPEVGLLDFSSS